MGRQRVVAPPARLRQARISGIRQEPGEQLRHEQANEIEELARE
jgi:hypothetical protein